MLPPNLKETIFVIIDQHQILHSYVVDWHNWSFTTPNPSICNWPRGRRGISIGILSSLWYFGGWLMMETRQTKCNPDSSLDPLRTFYRYHPPELSSRVESWVPLYVVALFLPIWICSEGGVWGLLLKTQIVNLWYIKGPLLCLLCCQCETTGWDNSDL